MRTDMLKSLRLLDADGTLSLSHITLFSALVLLCVQQSQIALVAFFIAIANHNSKKMFSWLKAKRELAERTRLDGIEARIDRMSVEIDRLNAAQTFRR
jgi:hypothetical protein